MRNHFSACLQRYPELMACELDIKCAYDLIADSFDNKCKLLICGNAGSVSDLGHTAGELLKSSCIERKISEDIWQIVGHDMTDNLQGTLPAISLPDMIAINTADANDCNPQYCFGQLTYGLGKNKDTLPCISTSGNAKNVIRAAIVAHAKTWMLLY